MSGIGGILSAIIEPLIKQLGSEVFKFLTNHKRVKSSFDKLSRSLSLINGVLEDAEEKQYTEKSVKQWLAALRDAAYDLEDLLDEIKTQAEMEKRSRRKEVYKLFHTPRTLIFNHKMVSKIQDIAGRLQDIGKQANDLKLTSRGSGGSGYGNRKDVTSVSKPHLQEDEFVVGRDEKKKEIIDMVCGSKDDLLVLPIYGMGGLGKTTLAKAVYYDTEVQQHFDVKAMACVSIDFNMLEVTRKIYHDVIKNEPGSKGLDTLQGELRTELVNKKFLIVLDDVWNHKSEDWENLICPFKKGQPGSIIMVTTRNEEIAIMVSRNSEPVELKLLNDADCLSLMLHHARISFNDKPDFKDVGMKLMRNCKGLPLAARALGGILSKKRKVEEWERVFNNKIWASEEENIMRVLRLSYFYLPPHLKRMFAYCSIFPQDYSFEKTNLVLLWMGEGFLDQHPNTQTKEEWGHQCFDELVMKSLFQYSSLDETEEAYVMHDLINDLAHLIAAETCKHWNGETSLEKVRHCSILVHFSRESAFSNAEQLRTLLFLYRQGWWMSYLPDLLPKLRHIRVLSLRDFKFEELPNSICNLTHLRYLNLCKSGIMALPDSLDGLIWLETLSIRGCNKISRLPKTLGNLCHLRHLDNSGTVQLKYLPFEIGKLEHLQTLSEVVLSKEGGFGLKELQNLKNLGGSLIIRGLENVASLEGVEKCLKFKKNLHELRLEWNMRNEFILAEDVLDCLEPPKALRKLEISGFCGSKFPSWVGDHSYTKLSWLSLRNCIKCTRLPPLGQLPNLKYLRISGMDNITCIEDELYGHGGTSIPFSKLESLSLWCLPNLRKWCISGTGDGHVFSHLKKLEIDGCEKLEDVSLLFLESLQYLKLWQCNVVLLKSFCALSSLTYFDACGISGLSHLPRELVQYFSSLEKLKIYDCKELETLWPEDGTLQHHTHLKTINITDCEKLSKWGSTGDGHVFSHLKELKIIDCWKLKDVSPLFLESLRKLKLRKCNVVLLKSFRALSSLTYFSADDISGLCHLPSELVQSFTSLEELEIFWCDELETLWPEDATLQHLTYLKTIKIHYCGKLRKWGSTGEGHVFSHLKELEIDHCEKLEDVSPVFLESLRKLKLWHCNRVLLNSFRALSSLTYFYACAIKGLCHLPCELVQSFTSLEELEIFWCDELETLWPEDATLQHLTHLKTIKIHHCRKLRKWGSTGEGHVFSHLKKLDIFGCDELETLWPEGATVQHFTHLKTIKIHDCRK